MFFEKKTVCGFTVGFYYSKIQEAFRKRFGATGKLESIKKIILLNQQRS